MAKELVEQWGKLRRIEVEQMKVPHEVQLDEVVCCV